GVGEGRRAVDYGAVRGDAEPVDGATRFVAQPVPLVEHGVEQERADEAPHDEADAEPAQHLLVHAVALDVLARQPAAEKHPERHEDAEGVDRPEAERDVDVGEPVHHSSTRGAWVRSAKRARWCSSSPSAWLSTCIRLK